MARVASIDVPTSFNCSAKLAMPIALWQESPPAVAGLVACGPLSAWRRTSSFTDPIRVGPSPRATLANEPSQAGRLLALRFPRDWGARPDDPRPRFDFPAGSVLLFPSVRSGEFGAI